MKKFKFEEYAALFVVVSVLFVLLPVAGNADVTVPNTFTSGTTISSSQVNANFSTLANAMSAATKTVVSGYKIITSTTGSSLASLTITPPADGQVLVIGTGTVTIIQAAANTETNWGSFSLNTVAGTMTTNHVVHSFGPYSNSASAVVAGSLNIIDIFSVIKNVPATFYLNAKRDTTGINTVQAEYPGLTAIFVPNILQ